jgi:hypothetical protein
MFVPGVNGSIIPSAPSGSRLKGAYKNSKKRKMPNGGIELALDAASFAPPPVGTVASLLGAGLNAYQGDYTGMGLDLASAASGGASKWFGAAAGAAKMANSGRLASSMASKAKTFQTLSNPVVSKTASVGRDYSNTVESSPYNNTMRVPQRDNTQVQFRPNPNLRKMDNGGWANWTPNTGKPLLRTSPAGNAGYSDNTKVITQNTNVTAANRKAAEAAEYAKRVGSVSQGKVKSNYEKAKEATSFVAQAEQRNGSASPLDHVLDMVNPASLAFAATDLVGNTGSAVSNAAQGNFKAAGGDLANAGLNALSVLPAAAELRGPLKSASKYLTTNTALKNTYKYNPLAFKPNPESYYRVMPDAGAEDLINSGFVRPAEGSPTSYFNKGVPLDIRRARTFGNDTREAYHGYKGPYMVESNNPNAFDPWLQFPEPSLKFYQTKAPIPASDIKLYKEDWLKGYKQIKKPGLKKGGEIDHDDDKEMVDGVASILRRVESKPNRLQLANQLSKQFNREKVNYNLAEFLKKSKVKK